MEWSVPQKVVLGVLILLCINYLMIVAWDKLAQIPTDAVEGFDGSGPAAQGSDTSLYTWTTDPQLIYDDFYAGVYDQLSHQAERTAAKTQLVLSIWGKDDPKKDGWIVMDAGCGTGHATAVLAKAGCGRVVALDYAPAMIDQAQKVVIPAAKLTSEQANRITWRKDSLINPSAFAAGEISHAICMYFTFYYLQDQEQFFRHMNFWIKTGGKLCVEVVNKHKFDPILESASPFVGFSLQKYSKDRIRKSKVTFDKFDYEAEFILTDPKAEFYETFRFKNNHIRRQKHVLYMPAMEQVVAMAKRAGWKYVGYQDLNPLGFEYAYLLMFEK